MNVYWFPEGSRSTFEDEIDFEVFRDVHVLGVRFASHWKRSNILTGIVLVNSSN